MGKTTYLVLLSLLIISCNAQNKIKEEQKKYFEFNNTEKKIKIIEYEEIKNTLNKKDLNLKLGKKTVLFSGDSLFIIQQEHHTNNLITYNLINGTYKKINFNKIRYKEFWDYGYINQDSIFLLYDSSEDSDFNDSLIFLCDASGKIIKNYSLENAPVLCQKSKVKYSDNERVFIISNWNEPFTVKDNKIFLHFNSQADYLGDTTFEKAILAGYIDIRDNNKFYPIEIQYPNISFGNHFFDWYDKLFFSTFAHDGDLLYAFKYTPTIIKYNYKTGKKKEFQIKSSVFDSIYSAPSPSDIPKGHDFTMPYPKYYTLQYDKYRHLYYRFILLPWQYGKMEFGKSNYMVIVADTSFNVIAEGFTYLNDNQYEFSFSKDFFFDGNKCYKMKFRDGTNTELISKIKLSKIKRKHINKPITHYVKNYAKISEKNYTALFMWRNETCEYTTNFFYKFFQNNEEKFEANDIYLIILADNVKKIKAELNAYNLSPEKHKNIFIDSLFEYGAYTNYETTDVPRIIKVRENKIVADNLSPIEDGGIEVQKLIIGYGKEQEKLKNK